VLLPFCKCILEVVFCEGVQHHLWSCLDHRNCVKRAVFQFDLQLGKQKSMVGGVWLSSCFWSKILWWKRKCEMVSVPLSWMFRAKSCHISTQSPLNATVVWRIDCFPLTSKKMSMLFTLLLTCLISFGRPELSMPFRHPCMAHAFFPERLSNHC
jgi:hypothetical protein